MRLYLFLIARASFILATQIQTLATGWQIYSETHSSFQLGLLGLCFFAPFVTTMPFAGEIADRRSRSKIAGISGALFAILVAAQAYWIEARPKEVLGIFTAVLGMGVARAFGSAAQHAMLPLTVKKDRLLKAISYNTTAFYISSIAGPALGGLIYAKAGPVATLQVASVFAFGGAILFALLNTPPMATDDSNESRFIRIAAGFRYIWGQKDILGSISLDLVAVFFGGAEALLPVFAQDILHIGPDLFGWLRSAGALGAIIAGVYLARRPITVNPGRAMFRGVFVFGLAMIVFGLSTNYFLSFACLFIAGGADMVSVFVRHGLLQTRVEERMRGRVSAVNQVFIGASNELGEFESGMVAAAFGPVAAVVGGAFLTLLMVPIWKKYFPELANATDLQGHPTRTG